MFLDTLPTFIPEPLQLVVVQAQDLLETASEIPFFTLQAIHLARAFLHLLIVLAGVIGENQGISQQHLALCLEMRSFGNSLENLFESINAFRRDSGSDVSTTLDEFRRQLVASFTTLSGMGIKKVPHSERAFYNLGMVDSRRIQRLNLATTSHLSSKSRIVSPRDLLLCIFVDSFKGDNSIFSNFPSVLARHLHQTIRNVTIESLVFPAYETKENLGDAVERFVDWLQREVLRRECSIEVDDVHSATGMAKVVLCGHSTGGLLISDALVTITKGHNGYEPLWPRIIALIAFDTPYLGIHPNLFNRYAEQDEEYISAAHGVYTGIRPIFTGSASLLGAASSGEAPTRKQTEAKSDPSIPSAQSDYWNKWAAIGGSMLATGAAAATGVVVAGAALGAVVAGATLGAITSGPAATRNKPRSVVTFSRGVITDHFKYLKNLENESAMKQRLDFILEASQNHKILFKNFYTYLPKQAGQPRPRTFIMLPLGSNPASDYFVAAHNMKAETEIEAHLGMFDAKSNLDYSKLTLKTAHFIKEAISLFLEKWEKTMEIDEKFDEEAELAKNRLQVEKDGREAEATSQHKRLDNADFGEPSGQ